MNLIDSVTAKAAAFVPTLATIALVIASLMLVNWFLTRRWKDNPDAQFRFQLIMLLLTLVGILSVVMALPINDSMRSELLGLIGILLSAAIALSSTTFIGNIMAGIMLKAIRSARPGDFITLGEITGRITEMDLLHTEIQTEFRDLVTVPNLAMVTQPLKVVRASGTIVSAEVSLGYELPNAEVRGILCEAAGEAGLTDAFAHVRELGDFSVTYRIAGLLEDVQSLISARSRLRIEVLDALHEAGIEIVSPNFMNTRARKEDDVVIPRIVRRTGSEEQQTAEAVVFDKAEEAASIEDLRKSIAKIDAELAEPVEGESPEELASRVARLDARRNYLVTRLEEAEKLRKESDGE